ncbi:hypothetical protein ACFLZ7_02285 [Nanoarchaeota archaeon]
MTSNSFERLFTNLALSSKRAEEKRLAEEKVHKQIKKIRKVSLDTYPPKKKEVEREIVKLEKNIAAIFEKENQIINTQKKDEASISQLQKKTNQLDAKLEKVNEILMSFGEKQRGDERENELESIELEPHTLVHPSEKIRSLKKALDLLEDKSELLKMSGKQSPVDLARVQDKINSLKQKLSSLI